MGLCVKVKVKVRARNRIKDVCGHGKITRRVHASTTIAGMG